MQYLKQHHKVLYYNLLTSGKLHDHLSDTEEKSQTPFARLVKALTEKENVNELLKATGQMAWVRRMNNIYNRAIEVVNSEVIFVCESKNNIYICTKLATSAASSLNA